MAALTRSRAAACRCVLVASLALFAAGVAHGALWTVRAGEDIQAAIDRAAAGDTVRVEHAEYDVHLVVAKPLVLEGLARPTLSGGNRGDVIRVKSPGVTVAGFIIRDSGDDLTAQNAGIYVVPGSDRVAILRNEARLAELRRQRHREAFGKKLQR